MEPGQPASVFRVEKRRAEAILTMVGGETARGCFFVAGAASHHDGAERVGDLLNLSEGFFPFEVPTADGGRTIMYNRAHVVTVELFENEAALDPGYAVAFRRDVSILLSDGRRVHGVVRIYRPKGHERLSDWTRQPETFRYVEAGDTTLVINAAHIAAITEVPPA